jgi:tetratricopeptide (TPR) repeat protein
MSQNAPSLEDQLRQRFPRMQPVKKAPSLHTINGIGVGVYGKRDFDAETGTYVKTRCLCLVFVPVLALDAWRVADAPGGGWYFLGKEPVSGFAKKMNATLGVLVLAAALLIAWGVQTSSPSYQAKQDLKAAAAALTAGDAGGAAGIYSRVAAGGHHPEEAMTGLKTALEACLQSDEPRTVEKGLRILGSLPGHVNQPAPLLPDGFDRGLVAVGKFRARDAEGALDVLAATAVLKPDSGMLKPLRIDLLKQAIAARADNTNRLVELALIHEADDQAAAAFELLQPHRQKLGATEGARILGQQYLERGEHGEAYPLLHAYVQAQLEKLRQIESAYTNALERASQSALNHLREGQADKSFYDAYERASEEQKQTMVDEFIGQRIQSDGAVQRAVEDLRQANRIVHVTLDLGMVQLNRAQDLADPAARKTELEAAEKTFLAIRGLAGETDEYRLFLGQVYYWLGRSQEGRQLFDELLASNQRAHAVLMALGRTLRDVGDYSQARELVEEAYRSAKDKAGQFYAAELRARLQKDLDDHIAWLEKADPGDLATQASLQAARGEKALEAGNKPLAAQMLRKAIEAYGQMPRNSSTLNNQGLVFLDLYQATGDVADYDRGLGLLEQAVALEPGHSILLMNTMYQLLSRAYMEAVGDTLLLSEIKETPRSSMLSHLYRNETGRDLLFQRLRENERMKKALAYLDKALLLAPKNVSLYQTALDVYGDFRDVAELRKLEQRFQVAVPDLSERITESLRTLRGERDKEVSERLATRIKELEALARSPQVAAHPATREYVAVSLLRLRQTQANHGVKVDGAALLAEARRTLQDAESSPATTALLAAHFFRAQEELIRQDARYAKLAEQTKHSLSPYYLITFVLEQGGPLAEVVGRNANVKQALALAKAQGAQFPSQRRIEEWAMFRHVDPAEAAAVARS